MKYLAYVGTCSVRGSKGIYLLSVDTDSGDMKTEATAAAINSGYLAVRPEGYVYTTFENMTFHGYACGGVGAYRVTKRADGYEIRMQNCVPAAGQLPCHISLSADGKEAYVSSYLNGCLGIHRIAEDGSILEAHKVIKHHAEDGIWPSVHCAVPTPDGKYLCVVDVKLHRIVFYERQSGEFDEAGRLQLPPPYDYRPRQIVFGRQTAYVVTELGRDMLALHYDDKAPSILQETQRFALVPREFSPMTGAYAACVRLSPDKGLLAGSVRGYNLITTFAADEQGWISRPVYNRTAGDGPRDFNFTPDGKALLIGGQFSDTMELARVDSQSGTLETIASGFHLPSCSCVCFEKQTDEGGHGGEEYAESRRAS